MRAVYSPPPNPTNSGTLGSAPRSHFHHQPLLSAPNPSALDYHRGTQPVISSLSWHFACDVEMGTSLMKYIMPVEKGKK